MASVWQLREDDTSFGMAAGDLLLCAPYDGDPEKLTVVCRLSDGFDPECNVYREQVRPVTDNELFRIRFEQRKRVTS